MTVTGSRTAYAAAHVVACPPEPARPDAAVLVDGDSIAGVVGRGEVPADYTVIDLGDQWLLPGLVDMHVHLMWDGGIEPAAAMRGQAPAANALLAAQRGLQHLMRGVTTVRDVAGPAAVVLPLRDEVASGRVAGPQVIASGPPVVMTGGHGWEIAAIADGPDEVRRAVRRTLFEGADLIKVMATGGVFPVGEDQNAIQYNRDELDAAVTAAHDLGRRVAAHAQALAGVRNAVESGVDTIEHGSYLDRDVALAAAERGQTLVPTLVAFRRYVDIGTEGGLPPHPVAKATDVFANGLLAVGYAVDARLRIAAGTDAGGRAKPHGCLAWELELLVEAGLSGADAVAAATTHAAAACGRGDFGTLQPGNRADLVGTGGDPYDVTSLRDVATVVANGRLVKREGRPADLESFLPAIGSLPSRPDARDAATLAC